jgi:hypothetical protein
MHVITIPQIILPNVSYAYLESKKIIHDDGNKDGRTKTLQQDIRQGFEDGI